MSSGVLDASVVLAVLFGEVDAADARRHLTGGCLSAVNYAEVLTTAAARGGSLDDARRQVGRYRLTLLPFDPTVAVVTASLRPLIRPHGLSLGDRACLATGLTLGLPVLTADRAWAKLDLGVPVEVIR